MFGNCLYRRSEMEPTDLPYRNNMELGYERLDPSRALDKANPAVLRER